MGVETGCEGGDPRLERAGGRKGECEPLSESTQKRGV